MSDDTNVLDMDGHKTTIVVTRETGKILGNVNRILVDRLNRKVAAISFRRKYLGKEYFLNIEQVDSIGEDVVFVRPEASAQLLTKAAQAPGEDLRNLQGAWVFSAGGEPIAAITDLGFNRKTWSLEALFFCDRRAIKVDAADVTIGASKIIVPSGMERQIFDPGEAEGLLAGIFGRAVVAEPAIILQRALKVLLPQPEPRGARAGGLNA